MKSINVLQYLSHQEQMDAHRRDFNEWWNRYVRETVEMDNDPPEAWILHQFRLWDQWKEKHGV